MRAASLILTAFLAMALPAIAQQRPEPRAKPMPPPTRGPAPYKAPKATPAHHANSVQQQPPQQVQQQPSRATSLTSPAIPTRRTSIKEISGSVTTPVPTTPTIISTIPGNMAISPAALAVAHMAPRRRRPQSLLVQRMVLERRACRLWFLRRMGLGWRRYRHLRRSRSRRLVPGLQRAPRNLCARRVSRTSVTITSRWVRNTKAGHLTCLLHFCSLRVHRTCTQRDTKR